VETDQILGNIIMTISIMTSKCIA